MWLSLTFLITIFWFSSFDNLHAPTNGVLPDQESELVSVPQLNQVSNESPELTSDRSTIDLQLDCRYQDHIELRELVPFDLSPLSPKSPHRRAK